MVEVATATGDSTHRERESARVNIKDEPFAMSIQEGVPIRLLLPRRVDGGPTMPVRRELVLSRRNSHRLTKAK